MKDEVKLSSCGGLGARGMGIRREEHYNKPPARAAKDWADLVADNAPNLDDVTLHVIL